MIDADVSERGLILAPQGRAALVAVTMLREAGIARDGIGDVAD